MRYSNAFAHKKNFFTPRSILSERQATFFIIEEAVLILIMVLQVYRFLGIEVINKQVFFFTTPFLFQNIVWLLASMVFFIIGYVVITLRDERVWLIHKNFSNMVFGTAKLKVQFTTKKKAVLFFSEIVYAFVLAIAIFVYLDPDINIVPYPYNYIGFVFLFAIGLFLFSNTKEYRTLIYGPTPVQKRLHFGKHDIRRSTNKRRGTIRISPRNHHKKRKWVK